MIICYDCRAGMNFGNYPQPGYPQPGLSGFRFFYKKTAAEG